jgi:photosystem II stability/assembly factor-like uncharacterized protein
VSNDFTILVGTVGNGMYRSADSGATFEWLTTPKNGICCNEVIVRGFGVDPFDANHVVAATGVFETPSPALGSRHGLHETFDGGRNWRQIESFRGIECWRVSFDPTRRGRYFVGARPAAIYRTEDGGESFQKLPVDLPQTCVGIGLPRITAIAIDRKNPANMFASVEIGGLRRSFDGGDSWHEVFSNADISLYEDGRYGAQAQVDCHFVAFLPGDPDLVVVNTADGPYASADLGETWAKYPLPRVFPQQFHHDFVIKSDDPDTILFGVGDDVVGVNGAVLRSTNYGVDWEDVELPVPCNSPVWCFAQHASKPDRILMSTHMGVVFASEDGGAHWAKLNREFGEVRAICWVPN